MQPKLNLYFSYTSPVLSCLDDSAKFELNFLQVNHIDNGRSLSIDSTGTLLNNDGTGLDCNNERAKEILCHSSDRYLTPSKNFSPKLSSKTAGDGSIGKNIKSSNERRKKTTPWYSVRISNDFQFAGALSLPSLSFLSLTSLNFLFIVTHLQGSQSQQ